MKTKDNYEAALAEVVANALKRTVEGPKVGGRIGPLEARMAALEQQLEDARSEINYLRWAREQETAKV